MGTHQRLAALLWASFLLIAVHPADGALSAGSPVRVRILWDNSGSMYPGYAPPGRPGTPKSVSGARYFHEYPEIREWLADFVARQTILDGARVSMSTFTSQGEFSPGDIREVHPEVPVEQFDIARAVARFPGEVGANTYLTEVLDRSSRGFEGLLWLITDNIVETRAGDPSADVRRFFQTLKDEPRYRSVHLFKYPFRDDRTRQSATLAVYGIVVSEADVAAPVLAYYDRKFRSSFRFANRRQGDPPLQLFPGREHLKLKDLNVEALELQAAPNLQVILDDPEKGLFKEGQKVQLELAGKIQSYLTQHSVTGGRYRLELAGPFEAESWARRDLGAQPLAPTIFQPVQAEIREAIPPNQSSDVTALLRSSQPVSFASRGGLGAWLRLAMNGAVIQYAGRVRMSFDDVQVRLERDQMAGIFGIEEASSIFDFQDVRSLAVAPSEATVSFALKTGSSRTAILLLLLTLLAAVLGIPAALLSRKRWYRIRITGTPERLVALRRLGSHAIVHEGQQLGRLSRGLAGDHELTPNAGSAAFTITPSRQPDVFDVRFRDGRGCQLSVEPQGGGGKPRRTRVDPEPGPPPTGPAPAAAPPARALPKIDRP